GRARPPWLSGDLALAAARNAPQEPAAQRQLGPRGRRRPRPRRRPAGPQEKRSLAAAADRRPRRAAVRLVQLEETDVFVNQLVDGVIYVAQVSHARAQDRGRRAWEWALRLPQNGAEVGSPGAVG